MSENEINNEFKSNENNELILNAEAKKALYKSHFKYCMTNGLLVFVPMVITIAIYFKVNNIDFDCNILLSAFWNILKQPSFFIPVLIAVFIKDILKYIFCGTSKDVVKYMEEAEKENSEIEGISKAVNANTAKQRFTLISALFSLAIVLFFVLIKQIFNFKTIISFVIAYLYAAHKFALSYGDFQQIILNKSFVIVFLFTFCIMNLFFKNKDNESQENNQISENTETNINENN